MSVASLLQAGLWLTPVVLQLLISAALIRKRLARTFSLFLVFSLYAPARDIALYLLQHQSAAYFWTYWIGEGVSLILQLLFLVQVARYLIRPYPEIRRYGNMIFGLSLVACAGFALVVFLSSVDRAGLRWIEFILLAERAARILQVSLLIVTLACVSRLGLITNRYAIGILLGSGVAGLQLIPFELRASLHAISDTMFIWLAPAIYDCAVLFWAAYLLGSRPPALEPPPLPSDVAGWDETVNHYLACL